MNQISPPTDPHNAQSATSLSATQLPVARETVLAKPLFGEPQPPTSARVRLSLRRQLLLAILPTVLLPLDLASTVGYWTSQQSLKERVFEQVKDQALLASQAARKVKKGSSAGELGRIVEYLQYLGIRDSQTVQLLDSNRPEEAIATVNARGVEEARRLVGGEASVAVGTELARAISESSFSLQSALDQVQAKYSLKKLVVSPLGTEDGSKSALASFIYRDGEGGENRYYAVATVPGTNWLAVASMNMAEIDAVGRELWGIFGVTALLLGTVAVGVVLLLARQLSAPLRNLAKTAERVAAGDLNAVAEPGSTWETQTLAQSFNNLVSRVKYLRQEQAQSREQLEHSRQQAEQVAGEQQQQNETLQRDLSRLIASVEGAASGDLTVRADVTLGEIGIVADFFNAIVESLGEIVTQVQDAANQVNCSVGENEAAIGQLAEEALQQAEKVSRTLNFVEQMVHSIQEVAASARAATAVAHAATDTAAKGEKTMDSTVASIVQLRDTIAETAQKVKRLGEASQEISQVIVLINEIALKTNYLAVNAGIEAARAGAEGKGFAVVAKEVGALASQSAMATKEIEQILENIQRETEQVVRAMAKGTMEVSEGNRLVEEAKQSLGHIVVVSRQIDALVQSISRSAASQAQASQAVKELMAAIAQISQRTADSSRQVASSLQNTVAIAEQLQASVSTFRVTE